MAKLPPLPMPSNTLVVFALEEEAQGLFDDFQVLYTGIGKVNASYRLTRALAAWEEKTNGKPDLVLNLGSAGSPVFKRGEVVNCTGFVQRDFDVTVFGTPPYTNAFENIPVPMRTGVRYPHLPEGVCGTGDNFATEVLKGVPWNVSDMEAFALAKVCHFENIPFASLKYITDGADSKEAAESWEETLPKTAAALLAAIAAIQG
ncbi:MAG: nucleosidase [Alphaproteobacteria bacterium]|nr:nucleosidase [Alphaproteobacteria bacterium]